MSNHPLTWLLQQKEGLLFN